MVLLFLPGNSVPRTKFRFLRIIEKWQFSHISKSYQFRCIWCFRGLFFAVKKCFYCSKILISRLWVLFFVATIAHILRTCVRRFVFVSLVMKHAGCLSFSILHVVVLGKTLDICTWNETVGKDYSSACIFQFSTSRGRSLPINDWKWPVL